jgi:hypothetical protein
MVQIRAVVNNPARASGGVLVIGLGLRRRSGKRFGLAPRLADPRLYLVQLPAPSALGAYQIGTEAMSHRGRSMLALALRHDRQPQVASSITRPSPPGAYQVLVRITQRALAKGSV